MKITLILFLIIFIIMGVCFWAAAKHWSVKMKAPLCGLKKLTPEQYRIMRENGTEAPFANEYWNNKLPGIYVDVITGEALFSSTDKFDSGTGWPSFTAPIKEDNVVKAIDASHGMARTEVRAKRSDSHLGHLFEDGPAPSGLRYCINSASLRFIPAEDLEKEGYAEYLPFFGLAPATRQKTETAFFGAGCFWGVESAFRQVDGVISTTVGYTGGTLNNPTYKDVGTDKTGHAEVAQVKYDPSRVSYEKLLDIFWNIHDPTTVNRQGADVGSQYRSVIFFSDLKQERIAKLSKEKLGKSGKFEKPIVTQISPAIEFYPAEEYHQKYYAKKGIKPTCHIFAK